MILKGDCLSCRRLSVCSETNAQKVYQGYTCQLFDGVPEPEYVARLAVLNKYGPEQAINAMLNKSDNEGEGEDGEHGF